jgi:hypothetical protein
MKLEKLGKGFIVCLHNADFHIQVERGLPNPLVRPTEVELQEFKKAAEKSYKEPFKVHLLAVDVSKDETGCTHMDYLEHGCICPTQGKGKKE